LARARYTCTGNGTLHGMAWDLRWRAAQLYPSVVRWPTQVAVYGLIATMGVGCGLYASRGGDALTPMDDPALTAHRVSGDPPEFASIEILPEGSNPQGTVVSVLDVTVRTDLPEPVETTCAGGIGVGVRLKSGRDLHYSPCAMPGEIVELRDSLRRAASP
jgi:hypothetical protein